MRAGDLKHSIVIQDPTEVEDGMGGSTIKWVDLYPTRAAIWPLKATEQIDAMKLELTVNHRIRIRHPRSINITAKMRVKWHDHVTDADKYFNIVSLINPNKRNIMLEMLCLEKT